MKSDYLFVYGTLQKSANTEMSRFLSANATLVGRATIKAKLFKISWFPAAVLSTVPSDVVIGTVFKLDDCAAVFDVLDPYEGYQENNRSSSLFVREVITAQLHDGEDVQTWVYLYNREVLNENQIASGDFLSHE